MKFKLDIDVRLLITTTRVFAFMAFIVGACYGFAKTDPVVMVSTLASSIGLFALNTTNKSKEKSNALDNH
jgi:hypothetical protein